MARSGLQLWSVAPMLLTDPSRLPFPTALPTATAMLRLLALPALAALSTLVALPVAAQHAPAEVRALDPGPTDGLAFAENRGQWPEAVLFRARLGGATAWVT